VIRSLSAFQTRYLARASLLAGPSHPVPSGERSEEIFSGVELVAAEIGPILNLSRRQAQQRVVIAENLVTELPAVLDLVQRGRTDLYRAGLVDELMREVLEPGTPQWDAVQDAMVAKIPGRTSTQIRGVTLTAIHTADPSAARRRHERANTDRRVMAWPLPDGMAALSATLRADHTLMVDSVLDALADGCRDHVRATGTADPRTHQQRRADAFTALFTAIHHGTPLPILPIQPTASSAPNASTESGAVAAAPDGEQPAARPISQQAAIDQACFGGTVLTPDEPLRPGTNGSGADQFSGTSTNKPNIKGSGRRAPDEHEPGTPPPGLAGLLGWWKPPALPTQQGRRPHLMLTMAASTYHGEDDLPGELHDYGPIPATLAREIAADAGQRTVVVLPEGEHPSEAPRSRDTSAPDPAPPVTAPPGSGLVDTAPADTAPVCTAPFDTAPFDTPSVGTVPADTASSSPSLVDTSSAGSRSSSDHGGEPEPPPRDLGPPPF
jgi:hypothetical protein